MVEVMVTVGTGLSAGIAAFLSLDSVMSAIIGVGFGGIGAILFIVFFFAGLAPSRLDEAASRRAEKAERQLGDREKDEQHKIKRLSSIGQQIRTLPERRAGKMDGSTIAGKLMLRAIDLGLFDEDRHTELRQVIEASVKGEFMYRISQLNRQDPDTSLPPPPWHAYVNAVSWIDTDEQGRSHEPFDDDKYLRGCKYVADHIEANVSRRSALLGD